MGIFDSKVFNSQVFAKYLETVPRVKQNAFMKAGIFRTRNDLKQQLKDQVGGNYITEPMTGLIGGDAQNYDGNTNIEPGTLGTFSRSMIVAGRMKAWKEKDFTFDITGKDFMEEIAKQVGGYWDDVDQGIILSILKGIFGTTTGGFANAHTYDITEETENTVNATTLNSAIQQASGANKNIYTLAIMHSQVSTNLENLQILQYGKGVDANGVEKDLAIATWNGRTVMIDDDVPFDSSTGTYTSYILGRNSFDFLDAGAKVPSETSRDPFKSGGEEYLITRQRKMFAPFGFSFIQPSTPIISPTNTQLEAAANWSVVKDESNNYLNHKAIPIVRIKSLG